MAGQQTFTYYDAENNRIDPPADAPIKLTEYCFKPAEWMGRGLVDDSDPDDGDQTTRTTSGEIVSTSNRWKSSATGAATILRVPRGICFECGRQAQDNDPECGAQCYRAWREKTTIDRQVRIKDVGGSLGYGAFLGPRGNIRAHQTIGEHIGDLRPAISDGTRYAYNFDNGVTVDASRAGNWARFMNSHCDANVIAHSKVVGKRQLIMYQALRAIAADEQLTCNYGPDYFQTLGIRCRCNARRRAHVPADIPDYDFVGGAPTRASTRRRAAAKSAVKGSAGKSTAANNAGTKAAGAKHAVAKGTGAGKASGKSAGAKIAGTKAAGVKSAGAKNASVNGAAATKAASKQTNLTRTRYGRVVKAVQR